MPDNWFSYREIAFQDKDCIIFIAENIETLESGHWPEPPAGRRMTDGPVSLLPIPKGPPTINHSSSTGGNPSPANLKYLEIAAEFRRRLELVTGSNTADHDRILFEEHCMNGVELYRIARIKASPVWLCDYRIKRVLKFLTGKGLKYRDGHPANYAEWVAKPGRSVRKPPICGII
jgi:hypothetical protein